MIVNMNENELRNYMNVDKSPDIENLKKFGDEFAKLSFLADTFLKAKMGGIDNLAQSALYSLHKSVGVVQDLIYEFETKEETL